MNPGKMKVMFGVPGHQASVIQYPTTPQWVPSYKLLYSKLPSETVISLFVFFVFQINKENIWTLQKLAQKYHAGPLKNVWDKSDKQRPSYLSIYSFHSKKALESSSYQEVKLLPSSTLKMYTTGKYRCVKYINATLLAKL